MNKQLQPNPHLDDSVFSPRAVPGYISSILSYGKVTRNDLFSLNEVKADKTRAFLECLFNKKNFQ